MASPNNEQFHIITPEKPSTKGRVVWIILGSLCVIALGAFGILWWQQRAENNSLQSTLSSTKDELAQQKKATAAATNLPTPQAKYTASVGRFTLTLGKKYYIIIDLDGPFEGGPATRLAIGTRNLQGKQTINSAEHSRITVSAYPLSGGTYSERVTSETSDSASKQKLANTTVAGVETEVYQLEGLFTGKKLFFTQNDIVYVISATSSEATQPVLDDIIKGFKFN